MSTRRTILAFALTVAAYTAASYPIRFASMHLLGGTYRACEFVGIMHAGGALGGQVAGFNFQREPAWVHPVARATTSVVAVSPALFLSLVFYHRAAFGKGPLSATLCGRCGAARRIEDSCACGHSIERESPGLRAGWLGARIGPARAMLARRIVLAMAVGSALSASIVVWDEWYRLRAFFTDLGELLGGQTVKLGRTLMGPDGPFFGDDLRARALNLMYLHGPHLFIALSGLLAAIAVLHACIARPRFFRSLRWLDYRGPTLCGRCRYRLAGLRAAHCPECGAS